MKEHLTRDICSPRRSICEVAEAPMEGFWNVYMARLPECCVEKQKR